MIINYCGKITKTEIENLRRLDINRLDHYKAILNDIKNLIAEIPKDDVRHFGNPFNKDPEASKDFGKSKMANIKAMLEANKRSSEISPD